jgi:hypothetical protein
VRLAELLRLALPRRAADLGTSAAASGCAGATPSPGPGAAARRGSLEYETRVKLFVEDAPTEWISGAIVCLYDRDRISRDDHLGTDVTDAYGEAKFRFGEEQFLDLDDRLGGSLPELYVMVYDTDGRCVLSTRLNAVPNAVPDLIRVPVARDLAERHGLL